MGGFDDFPWFFSATLLSFPIPLFEALVRAEGLVLLGDVYCRHETLTLAVHFDIVRVVA